MVRCEVTGRSRGSSRDHTSLAAVPLRTLSRVFGRVREPRVDGSLELEGAGEVWRRGGMRETFSSVPTARRLSPGPSSLSLLLPSVGRTATRARARASYAQHTTHTRI